MPIRKAIRMSMSVPFVFEPVMHDGCYYVDGGTIDNYPIKVFDGKYPNDFKNMSGIYPPDKTVLGLRLLTPYDDTSQKKVRK